MEIVLQVRGRGTSVGNYCARRDHDTLVNIEAEQ